MSCYLALVMICDNFPSKIKVVGDIHLSIIKKTTGVVGSLFEFPFLGSIGGILQSLEGVLHHRVVDLATFYRAL